MIRFNTYKDAHNYWKANKNSVPEGFILGISSDGKTVRQSLIVEPEKSKRDRSEEKNTVLGVISDDLGVKGILNHADGKMYDSKSQYRKALKARKCVEIGNDFNGKQYKTPLERGVRGNFNVLPELKDAINRVIG